jgi:hypothetical protein
MPVPGLARRDRYGLPGAWLPELRPESRPEKGICSATDSARFYNIEFNAIVLSGSRSEDVSRPCRS